MAIYLDPGTGSLVIQFTIGAITGLLALFRRKSKAPRTPEQHVPRKHIQDTAAPGESLDETRK